MRHAVAQVDPRGQESVDEDRLVLRSRTDSPPARPIEQLGISAALADRPHSATKSAITEIESPVIRRSDMIRLRAAIPSRTAQRPSPTAVTPTVHELVGR